MIKRILNFLFSGIMVGGLCLAQEAEDAAKTSDEDLYKVSSRLNGLVIGVGKREIRNIYLNQRQKAKREAMFRLFMHGVVDGEATPVAWESIGDDLPLDQEGFKTPLKTSELPSIVLNGGETISLPKPVIPADKLVSLRGKYIRVFIWIMGEGTGLNADLWSGSPTIKLEIVDYDGEILSTVPAYFRTRGTFPWFCYHLDVEVPYLNKVAVKAGAKEAEKPAADSPEVALDVDALLGNTGEVGEKKASRPGGLYVTLSNPASGVAKFSTLSWMPVREAELLENPALFASRIDPKTNSTAPNPDYDELPMHLMFGISGQGQWKFLKGNNAWQGIATSDQLSSYIDSAAGDWMHCLHAIPKLVSIYNNGTILKTMPELDAGWKDTLRDKLAALQDTSTGLWTVGGVPSLFATYAVVTNSFFPTDISHRGYASKPTPWLSLDDMKLQNVDAMIGSIISQQKNFGGKSGLAGWNDYAFMENVDDIDDVDMPCDMAATACAVRLLAIASRLTGNEKLKAQAENSIYAAWQFVMKYMFMRSTALWKNSFADKLPTVPGSMYDFIEGTAWLDLRQNKALRFQPPITTLDQESGSFTLKWKPEKGYVSLRVFAAPADKVTAELAEENLVAIVQPKAGGLLEQDPYIAIGTITAEANKRWKITPSALGADYIAAKLAGLPKSLKTFNNPANVKFKIPKKPYNQAVHVAAVNAYGEMSQFITLPETISAQAEETGGN